MRSASSRATRHARHTIRLVSRRGLQFVLRASLGGLLATALFAAGQTAAQVVVPPDATGTANNSASSFGAQSITLNGGTLTLNAINDNNPGLFERFFDGSFGDGNIDPIDPSNPNSLLTRTPDVAGTLLNTNLSYDGEYFIRRSGIAPDDTIGGAWFGRLTVGGSSAIPSGDITFGTRSDDGSVIFVDLNQNGSFEAAELIVNNKGGHGARNRAGSITLADGSYNVAIAWYEGTGGEFMEARVAPGVSGHPINNNANGPGNGVFDDWFVINPGAANQAGAWGVFGPAANPNFSANAVTVTADATINVDARPAGASRLGALTLAPNVTLTKTGGALTTAAATITGAGAVAFRTSGGALTLGSYNTGTNAVALTKSGSGELVLGTAANTLGAGSTFDVRAGVLTITGTTTASGAGTAPITLRGGTLRLRPDAALETQANALGERFFDGVFILNGGDQQLVPLDPTANRASFLASTADATGILDTALSFDAAAVDTRSGGVTGADGVAAGWFGTINVGGPNLPPGEITFATRSDDGSVIFVDENDNGIFEELEMIVDNRGSHGARNRAGSVTLPAGDFKIGIGWYEGTGGEFIEARFAPGVGGIPPGDTTNQPLDTYNTWTVINPGAASQAGIWSATTITANPNFTSNAVTVAADSAIDVDGLRARAGTVTINPGITLTETGGDLNVTTTNVSGTGATFDVAGTLRPGNLVLPSGATATKTGSGDLTLSQPGTNIAAGSQITVEAGRLVVADNAGLGGSLVNLSGGTLRLEPVPIAGAATLVGTYTGRFYNLAPGSGSDSVLLPATGLDSLTPVETVTTLTAINFPGTPDNPFTSVMTNPAVLQLDDHASRFTGQINVAAAGDIGFFTNSDDGSVLWVDLNNDGDFLDAGEEVVDNRGLHAMRVRTGARLLTPGNYNIKVEHFERGGNSGIIAGFSGSPVFNNNVNVTANSTIDVAGDAASVTVGNIALADGARLTKTGNTLRAGNVSLGGSSTLTVTGEMTVVTLVDGASSGAFTKAGGGTLAVQAAGDLSGTTVNVTGGGLNVLAAGGLADAVAINVSGGGGLRPGHADAISAATPINVGRASFVDFEVAPGSSRRITVEPFGALVGQLDNLTYGTGPGQVNLVNNSVLGPDPGETNLPPPLPAGDRLLLGILANNQTATHGGETSTSPTDLYRGMAIGEWTQAGALTANLSSLAGAELNIHLIAAPGDRPGNLTFKSIEPAATQFNSPTRVVNILGQGRLIIDAGGNIGGTWTTMNRTGDPDFLGANNVILEAAGGDPPGQIGDGKTVNIRHGSLNLPAGGGVNTEAVTGTANIMEGGTLILDDTRANSPATGAFNIAGAAGTNVVDLFGTRVLGPSTGPGAIYISQNNQRVLSNGATFNVGPGFLLVLDHDNSTSNIPEEILAKADYILDHNENDVFNTPFIFGNGRRLTTPATQSVDLNNNAGLVLLTADPAVAGTPGAKIILSAAEGRQLDINEDNPDFTGVDVQIGDSSPFTTTQGNTGRTFAGIRVGRVTVPQTGRVRLDGLIAKNVILKSGRVEFEGNINPALDPTGNFVVEEGTLFVNNNTSLMAALEAGNFGRAGAEIQLHDGGALYTEFERGVVRTVTQTVRTIGAGKSYLVLDQGGGTGDADVKFANVTLASGSTLDLGQNGGNTILRANINATAGNAAIENNASDTDIHVTVNAGTNPITFLGSRLTQLDAPVTASAIRVGFGPTQSGRLSVANLLHVGATPISISPFSHLAFNPGTGNSVTPNLANITQGSGTLRAQSGTVDFGSAVLSGSTVAPTTVAGLQHSVLPGSANLAEANANTDVQLGPLAATTPNLEGTFGANGAFGQVNSTHVYSGEFFDADGIVAFAEHFDDRVLLRIDGRTVLDNGAFNVPTTSPDDDANTPGLQTNIGPGNGGWHTFELRLGQGTGGVGAPGTQGGVTWPFGTFGFGFNPDPGTSITGATQQSNYQPMLDNGSMNLFRSVITPGAGDLFVDGGATMRIGGFTNQDSLTLNGSATATANLTLTNTSGTNTLLRTNVSGLGAIDNAAGSTVDAGGLTTANNATLTKLGGGTLNVTGAQSHGTGTTLTVSAGTANVNTDAGSASARRLTVNANSATNFGSSQHLAALNVGAGSTATLTAAGAKNLVTGGLTIAGGVAPTGTLNVTDNAVIVDFPAAGPNPAADIRSQIISGRGGTDLLGTWTGQGITSSLAAADPGSVSVGFAVNADLPLGPYTNFRGETVDPTAVIIRGTRNADANLDGVVGDDDVTIVGATFGMTTGATWALGDFTYDGAVNDDDVTLLGALYDPSAPPLGGAVAVATGVAAVPEPASWLMMALGGLGAGLFGWRRRRKVW